MIELKAVNDSGFKNILQRTIQGFAKECIDVGRWTADEADAHAKSMIERDLPNGLNTPGNLFFYLYDTATENNVGHLWLEEVSKDNLPTLFIADLEIKAAFRQRGYATATLTAIENLANEKGIKRICLHVFRTNQEAQNLYQKLGFKVTGLNMLKNLQTVKRGS